MAPTILKDGRDDSVSVRRKSPLRGLGRHESRLLLDGKTELYLFPRTSMRKWRSCTFLTHLSMRPVRVMVLDVERTTCGNFLVTFQQCGAAHIRVAVVHVSVTLVTP